MPVPALAPYDPGNIFARILRGEIPSQRVYEDDFAVAFHDINPQAPVHVLVVPRGAFARGGFFGAGGGDAVFAGRVGGVGSVARRLGLEEPGYRLLANAGHDAHQEVPHLHVHIFGGRPLGTMLATS